MRPELPELVYAGEGQEALGEVLNSILAELHYWRGLVGTGGATVNLRTDRPVIAGGSGGSAVVAIKTKTSVTGRSGSTPGTGTAYLQQWDGSALSNGPEIEVRNHAAGAWSADKHGFAVRWSGEWRILSLEC